ncbi:spore maturation protein B [cyanobacterium endosymbiont of Rhopalodia gibberula]|uniref:nucleoside recognition domain-containing protein n=1 Tax=cyanobacterium endosymbiont of Rhopalodia gibberula TaxID=1763363 RepID=UPI000DC70395|nr:nucleoside recognition domain-containing protein [cyanobacterium endosymbiont of Rhopalodia gibberula]BBA79724.1 spore maturation protein B [cyanobacterium endosymbiont of Rhopalodia gibberula]
MTFLHSHTRRPSAIDLVFVSLMAISILLAGYTGRMEAITKASVDSAKSAVELAIGLIGIMALWLGLIRVLEAGGLMLTLAQWLKPLMIRLFPGVPPTHPAMGAMLLNISANMLGLGNAATPFGLKAMAELDKLNPLPGTATNAMCLFLAINTSSVALLPLGVIGVRAAAGSTLPAAIWMPTFLATTVSTVLGILVSAWLGQRDQNYAKLSFQPSLQTSEIKEKSIKIDSLIETEESYNFDHLLYSPNLLSRFFSWGCFGVFLGAILYRTINSDNLGEFIRKEFLSHWLLPALILLIVVYGVGRGVKVYEAVTEGAKQGFEIAIRIIPFLVVILVAIGMFRASGAMDKVIYFLSPYTNWIGLPVDVLPMALLRPLSGNGAFALMTEAIEHDPNSYSAFVSSIIMGSTETTFYVLAVYFGSIGITNIRHGLVAALLADTSGILSACLFARIFWSG